MIPTKIDTSSQNTLLVRCIESIRRIYPETKIVVVIAKNSIPVYVTPDEHTILETNPGFSVFGCLMLFNANKYADQAWILHDSIVLLKPVPNVNKFAFVFHFNEPGLDIHRNNEGYRRLLSYIDYNDMVSRTKIGCFGNMFVIDHDEIKNIEILRYCRHVQTKYDFECMERIVGFLALKNGYSTVSVCGDIFDPVVDPWVHTEYVDLTIEQCQALSFPTIILKAIIGRR